MRLLNKKKGVFFSIDVLIALIILLMVVLVVYPVAKYSRQQTYIESDLMNVLSSIKVGDVISEPSLSSVFTSGEEYNSDNTLLVQIGEFYVKDDPRAEILADWVLNELHTEENIGIWYGDELISKKENTPYDESKNIDVERRIVSGLIKGSGGVTGYSARAYLKSGFLTKYFYFGGYVGEGNISAIIQYNGEIEDVDLELVINDDFEVYVNNVKIPETFSKSGSEFEPVEHDLSGYKSYFNSGENVVKIVGDNLHIAGGYIRVIYKTEEAEVLPKRYYFPGVEGLINFYGGFYIPNDIDSMKVMLHVNSNESSFLTIGNATIFNDTTSNEEFLEFEDSEISTKIDYSNFADKSVPVRVGLNNISSIINGSAKEIDMFSVTDLSGSMTWGSPSRISVAKTANKELIDFVLNESTNRMGLVGYSDRARDSDFLPLMFNMGPLKDLVDDWYALGSTCICCGINKAILSFIDEMPLSTSHGLLTYYNLDDNVINQVNGNEASITSNFNFVPGVGGNALDSLKTGSGGDAYLESYTPFDSHEGTISFWVNIDTFNGYEYLLRMAGGGNYLSISRQYSNYIYFYLKDDTGQSHSTYLSNSANDISLNRWYHLALVFSETNPCYKVYLNGILKDSENCGSPMRLIFYDDRFYMGADPGTSPFFHLRSKIDEIRVYDRALSEAEILELNNTNPVCGDGNVQVGELCEGSEICQGTSIKECSADCMSFGEECIPTTNGNCGDDDLNIGEECDDGNKDNYDGCSDDCKLEDRYRAMIVMSDGAANYYCSGFSDTIGDGVSYPMAKEDAIESACYAWEEYGIHVHSVGFGEASEVDFETLEEIAECGNGTYQFSDLNNLTEVLKSIATYVFEASYKEQTLEATENVSTVLYPDSYIEFEYDEPAPPYGLAITSESKFIDSSQGIFSIPGDSEIVEANVVSYSGPKWTDKVEINNQNIYNLSEYGDDYVYLGDPYFVHIPISKVTNTGSNIVTVTTGTAPDNTTTGSANNKIIYKVIKEMVAYSKISPRSEGCYWSILFYDDSVMSTTIPSTYSPSPGSEQYCYYDLGHHSVSDSIGDETDATRTATFNLLKMLDFNDDGKIDAKFSEQSLSVGSSEISGIPYSFSTPVKIIKWR